MRLAAPVELSLEQRAALQRVARQRSLPARVVERARIVLLAADGLENRQIAQRLRITQEKAARWRSRFLAGGITALQKDAPRPGKPRTITDHSVKEVVEMTLHQKPANATHWSTRSMARAAGISEASVRRIWRAHGLKPHRVRTFKLSNDPEFVQKLEDIVGLYLNPPEHAIVLCADEKSQIQALDRTQPGLPMKKCRYQVSLTSGTILHRTKIPLTHWFWAGYLMTIDKRGVSALLLQRQLGLTCYETAWMMLHKLRRAMLNATREPPRGEVEVDDTWIGGEQAGLRGSRQFKGRRAALVLVAGEKRGRASGRTGMSVIPDFKAATIRSFLSLNVATASSIYTDGLKSFSGLAEAGYRHVVRIQPLRSELRKGAKSAVPLADRAIGNLQQWLIGTYHGVSKNQLQVYLDESAFRHNRRKTPAAAFQTLLGLGTARSSTGYEQIRGAKDLIHNPLGFAEATR